MLVTSRAAFLVSVVGLVLVAFNQRPAVASVPPVLGELGLGSEAQSLLVTIPVVCFGVGALAGPRMRRLFGEERAIFFVVSLLVLAIAIRAVFLGWTLFPATIVIGLSIGVLNVLMPSLVKRRFPERPGAMTSAYVASATLGPALAAGLTVPVMHAAHGSMTAALGFWALPAVVALLVWTPQLRIGRPAAPVSGRATSFVSAGPPARVWRRRLGWQLMVYMGIGSLVFYGPLSWLPEIYRSRGMDAATAGYLLLTMNFVGMIGSLIAPLLAGRVRDQRRAVIIAAAVTLIGFLGLLLGSNATAFLWVAIIGAGTGSQFGLALLLIVLRAADGHTAAGLSSMAQSGGYLIAATGPLVMGLLHSLTGGWAAPVIFLILATVFGMVMGYEAGKEKVITAR